jgi:GTP cyclohydrolase FolE2
VVAHPGVPDVQMQAADLLVVAGIADLRMLFYAPRWTLPIWLSVLTGTNGHRGVHMSRLVRAANRHAHGEYLELALRRICAEVNRTQPGTRVRCELEYPFRDQFMPIHIELAESGAINYTFERTGMTACPCSKAIAGVGHMQRTTLQLRLTSDEIVDFEEVALRLDECFSASPVQMLKRTEEAVKVQEAQANPRFVEDVVRECVRRFPEAEQVMARALESIHAHDAVAIWSPPRRAPILGPA